MYVSGSMCELVKMKLFLFTLKAFFIILGIGVILIVGIDASIEANHLRIQERLDANKTGWVYHPDKGVGGAWFNYKTGRKAMANWDFRVDEDGNRY